MQEISFSKMKTIFPQKYWFKPDFGRGHEVVLRLMDYLAQFRDGLVAII